jgi:hypothetical protein
MRDETYPHLIEAARRRVEAIGRLMYPGLDLGRGDHLPWRWWMRAMWRVVRNPDAGFSVERGQVRRVDPGTDIRTATSSEGAEGRGAPEQRRLGRAGLAHSAEVLRRAGSPARGDYNGPRRSR